MAELPDYIPPEVPEPAPPVTMERAQLHAVDAFCTRPFGTDCARCVTVCPHGAVTLSGQAPGMRPNSTASVPRIDDALCTSCGLCRGVCDAFCTEDVAYDDLLARLRRAGDGGRTVYVTCAEHVSPGEEPADNVEVLPCLASVPPEFWAASLLEGLNLTVQVDFAFCDTCFCAGPNASALFSHAIELAERWTGRTMSSSDTYPLAGTIWDAFAELDSDDRRDLISGGASMGLEIATGEYRKRNSGAMADFIRKNERVRARGYLNTGKPMGLAALRADANDAGPCQLQRPRLECLVEAVRALPEEKVAQAAGVTRWFAVTDEALCTRCGACMASCPTAARHLPEAAADASAQPASPAAATEWARCIGCGACMTACPADAIDFIEGNGVWFLSFQKN